MYKTNEAKKKAREEKIAKTLDKVVTLFESGNVPEKVALVTFPSFDIPCVKWSLCNRVIMVANGHEDARGFKQWKDVGRTVNKGTKAFHILAPRTVKVEKEGENGEMEEGFKVVGFTPIPVFGKDQTAGEELEYEKLELPPLPLIEKAEKWGIDVKAMPFSGDCYGYYENGREKIRLASPEEKVFFHELSHAAHKRINGNIKGGQDPKQEIVAELSAQVLAYLVGTKIDSQEGNSYRYIRHYAQKMGKTVGGACLAVLADVEKVLALILS